MGFVARLDRQHGSVYMKDNKVVVRTRATVFSSTGRAIARPDYTIPRDPKVHQSIIVGFGSRGRSVRKGFLNFANYHSSSIYRTADPTYSLYKPIPGRPSNVVFLSIFSLPSTGYMKASITMPNKNQVTPGVPTDDAAGLRSTPS